MPSFFYVVSSDIGGFGSVSSPLCTDAPPNVREKNGACNFQDHLGRKRKKKGKKNAEFLPLPNVAHLPVLGTLKDEGKKSVKAKPKIRAIAYL